MSPSSGEMTTGIEPTPEGALETVAITEELQNVDF
jgi:hypothetical protein